MRFGTGGKALPNLILFDVPILPSSTECGRKSYSEWGFEECRSTPQPFPFQSMFSGGSGKSLHRREGAWGGPLALPKTPTFSIRSQETYRMHLLDRNGMTYSITRYSILRV
jgi:hypothetical protein